MSERHIYVVLSRTHTGFGKVVRTLTHAEYNHAALSFDRELTQMYAFARPRYRAPILGRLTHETTGMYTHDGEDDVCVRVYQIPIEESRLGCLHADLLDMAISGKYIYNFPSMLSFPVFKGVHCDRMYTCSEFVAWCLSYSNVKLKQKEANYTPMALADELESYRIFTGTMLAFADLVEAPNKFYGLVTPVVVGASVMTVGTVIFRTARQVASNLNLGR